MSQTEPRQGRGCCQWNVGWLGGQIGGTAWLLPLAVLLAAKGSAAAVVAFGCFVASNLVGWRLWRNRARLDPYTSVQILLGVLGLSALIALLTAAAALRGIYPGSMYWGALLVFPGLMVLFHFLERAARRRGSARELR